MQCTKTGCHVYISEYGEYGYGDAFEAKGVAVFRLVQVERKPIWDKVHYTLLTVDHWFDKGKTDGTAATLIAENFINHGYEGVDVKEVTS